MKWYVFQCVSLVNVSFKMSEILKFRNIAKNGFHTKKFRMKSALIIGIYILFSTLLCLSQKFFFGSKNIHCNCFSQHNNMSVKSDLEDMEQTQYSMNSNADIKSNEELINYVRCFLITSNLHLNIILKINFRYKICFRMCKISSNVCQSR